MKPIVYFLPSYRLALLISLLAVQIKAQSAPFLGANTIMLSTFLADQQANEVVTAVLAEQSLSVTWVDNRLLIRSQRNSAPLGKRLIFEGHIVLNAGVIELTGRVLESPMEGNTSLAARSTPILFAKGRHSVQRLGFAFMDALARQLQSALRGSLTYKYQANTI